MPPRTMAVNSRKGFYSHNHLNSVLMAPNANEATKIDRMTFESVSGRSRPTWPTWSPERPKSCYRQSRRLTRYIRQN